VLRSDGTGSTFAGFYSRNTSIFIGYIVARPLIVGYLRFAKLTIVSLGYQPSPAKDLASGDTMKRAKVYATAISGCWYWPKRDLWLVAEPIAKQLKTETCLPRSKDSSRAEQGFDGSRNLDREGKGADPFMTRIHLQRTRKRSLIDKQGNVVETEEEVYAVNGVRRA